MNTECSKCKGEGYIIEKEYDEFNKKIFRWVRTTCPTCRGKGFTDYDNPFKNEESY